MDWIRALEEEKKNKRVESRPYQTNQTDHTHRTVDPPKMSEIPFLDQKEGYPIPTDEAEFAADERAAIIEFDGDIRDDLIQNVLRIFQGRYAQPTKPQPDGCMEISP
jgi:hypothetical protein